MKTLRIPALLCALVLTLCACGGKTADVTILPAASDLYTQEEIDAATDAAMRYFKQRFHGCTLLTIGYAGDERTEQVIQTTPAYSMGEAIVLTSSFETDSTVEEGSIMPNETYSDWQWILRLDADGHWQFSG